MNEWHDGTTNTATMQALMDARNAGAFDDTKDSPGSNRGCSVPMLALCTSISSAAPAGACWAARSISSGDSGCGAGIRVQGIGLRV